VCSQSPLMILVFSELLVFLLWSCKKKRADYEKVGLDLPYTVSFGQTCHFEDRSLPARSQLLCSSQKARRAQLALQTARQP